MIPRLWGIQIAAGIPVITAVRILTVIYVIYLLRKKVLFKYYRDFFKAGIFTFPIMLIVFSLLVSSFFSANFTSSIFFFGSFLVEYLIIPVAIFSVCKRNEDINVLVRVICYTSLFVLFLGFFERFTQYNFYNIFGTFLKESGEVSNVTRSGGLRIRGAADHPIALGAYYALVFPFILYYLRDKFFLRTASLVLFFTVITFTDSRAGQVGFIIVFIIYYFIVERHRWVYCLFMPVPFASGSFRYRLQTLSPFFKGDAVLEASTIARSAQFNFMLPLIQNNLVFGHGMVSPPALMRTVKTYASTVDNFYLYFTWLYGLMGLFSWTLLMLYALIKPILYLRMKVFQEHLLILIISGVIAFCVINSVVADLTFHFMFWIYIGIITRILYNHINGINE